jgi:hypothetical protein
VTNYISGEWSATDVSAFLYQRQGRMRTTSSVMAWFRSHGVRGHHGRHKGAVLISNCFPALLSDEEALALDLRIAQSKWKCGGKRKHTYALSGILTCAHCKQKLVCSTTKNSAGSLYPYIRCNSPGCAADKHRIPHDKLERWLVQVRLAAEAGRLFDTRAQRTNETAPPSTELLNARKRAARLRQVLAEFDSPGVRSDLREAEERLRKLEAPRAQRPSGGGWERFTAAADGWWAEASPTERNSELLAIVERAEVDLTAWRRLPPEPSVAGDSAGFTEHEEWEEACGRLLIPLLRLRG